MKFRSGMSRQFKKWGMFCVFIWGMLLVSSHLWAQSALPISSPRVSSKFRVAVGKTEIPVYLAQVIALPAEKRQQMKGSTERDTDRTSFAGFDLSGPVTVVVTHTEGIKSVKILPSSLGITPTIHGNTFVFTVAKPGQLTIEVNENWVNALHLFADPVETNIPNPNDPNVIYFGPGVHQVQSIEVASGKTVYLARGAIVYGNPGGEAPNRAIFYLHGSNIILRGRGIIDASLCPLHTRSIVGVSGTNIKVEGVTLRDSSGFTLPVRRSDQVKIDNVKIFGWRANSDGMDICNSRSVEVRNSFVRTFDDLIVLKTDKNQGELRDVTVKNCVLWNEFAHALSLGAELREPLSHILFSDCDIIRDKGREWLLRVYHCDSASVKDVVFDNIRIEEARRLMSVWIGQAIWSKETERGHIDEVTFRGIRSVAPSRAPLCELIGFDPAHKVNKVQFQNVVVNGRQLKESDLKKNPFVGEVSVSP